MNFKQTLSKLSLSTTLCVGFLSLTNATGVAKVKTFDALLDNQGNMLSVQKNRVISQNSSLPSSTLETQIISQINQARENPVNYANWLETQKQYYDGIMLKLPGEKPVRTNRGLKALEEAIDFIRQQTSLDPLTHSENIAIAAQEQLSPIATTSNGSRRNSREQNITYGKVTAEAIVMQLVVDDGFRDRRHRLAIFRPENQEIGVSCREDPVYEQICAIAYAGNSEDTVPEEILANEDLATEEAVPKIATELPNPIPTESESTTTRSNLAENQNLEINPEIISTPENINTDKVPIEENIANIIEEPKAAEATDTTSLLSTQPNKDLLIDKIERGFLEDGDKVIPNDGSLYDSYPLSVKAGESFIISLESTDFDTFLAIMDEEGNIVEQNDDVSENDSNSKLEVTIPNDGTYSLIVNSYEKGGKGAYILTIGR